MPQDQEKSLQDQEQYLYHKYQEKDQVQYDHNLKASEMLNGLKTQTRFCG